MASPDLIGVAALYVCAALVIVAFFLMGKVGAKETAAMALWTGIICFLIGAYDGFVEKNPLNLGAFLLFAYTYFYLFFNIMTGTTEQPGLGWYCLFVVLACIPFIYVTGVFGMYLMCFLWVLRAYLWGLFWLLLALKKPIVKLTVVSLFIGAAVIGVCGVGFLFGWLTPYGIA